LTEESYDLSESRRSVRELYPVLLDAYGNVIDGYHRLRADPAWRTETLEHIQTPTQLVLARIIANTHRRNISRGERAEQIERLARALVEDENVPREELIPPISELTTFSDRYIRDLLPDEYKLRPGAGPRPSVEPGSTQSGEFDEALRRIGIGVSDSPMEPESDSITRTASVGPNVEAPVDRVEQAEEYLRRYFERYLRPDEDFLAWDVARKYGITEEDARSLIEKIQAERTKPDTGPRPGRTAIVPETPSTCTCPLCGRSGADRNLILMRVEDPKLAQLTLTEFITEALQR